MPTFGTPVGTGSSWNRIKRTCDSSLLCPEIWLHLPHIAIHFESLWFQFVIRRMDSWFVEVRNHLANLLLVVLNHATAGRLDRKSLCCFYWGLVQLLPSVLSLLSSLLLSMVEECLINSKKRKCLVICEYVFDSRCSILLVDIKHSCQKRFGLFSKMIRLAIFHRRSTVYNLDPRG